MKTKEIALFTAVAAILAGVASCNKNDINSLRGSPLPSAATNQSLDAVNFSNAVTRKFYEVISDGTDIGKIYVYNIDKGHHLDEVLPGPGSSKIKGYVRGVCANAKTGYLYFSYYASGGGNICCLNMNTNKIVFDKPVTGTKSIDRLTMNPDGKTLYVPSGETNGTFDFLWQVDAMNGNISGKIVCAHRTHDALWPLSGPLFQECKSTVNNEGRYMYKINPNTNTVTKIGLYSGILGPFAIDSKSHYMVNCVTNLLGMQMADITTNKIITVKFKNQSYGNPTGLLHSIGYTPDETEVWEGTGKGSADVVIWDMTNPISPKEKQTIKLHETSGTHWITFSIKGDYAYISPYLNSNGSTEVWNPKTHSYIQSIQGTQTMIEADFSISTNKVVAVGDQYGIGRK